MKVLTIGSDRKLFEDGSDVRSRIIEYGSLFDELHIIVFSTQKLKKQKIGPSVWIYPTNSRSRFLYAIDAVHVGKKIIREALFDRNDSVISTQDPFEAGLAGWFLKRASGIPLQLQIHADFLSPYFAAESIVNRIRVLVARFLIPRADGIRVVSERIKRGVIATIKNHGLQISVLPIFVDIVKIKEMPITENLRAGHALDDFILLMASRFTKEKNISMALQVMRDADIREKNIFLYIVGDGPEKKILEANMQYSGGLGHVKIKGWSGHIVSYYKTADAFLLTSNYEGYGRTAVEAAAAGTPIIMTDVGIAGDVIKDGEGGIIIPTHDHTALKNAIMRLYQNREEAHAFAKGAYAAIERAAVQTYADYLYEYKRILEQCLKQIKK